MSLYSTGARVRVLLSLGVLTMVAASASARPQLADSRVRLDCPRSFDDILVHEDLVYARPEGGPLRLDLHVPADTAQPARSVLLVHDLRQDRKGPLACMASALASAGLAAATIEYRGPYERLYPAALEDVLAATHWLRSNRETYGLDAGPVAVAGEGFGGYLAALVGLSAPGEIQGVTAIGAPMDPASGDAPWAPWRYPFDYHAFLGFPEAQRPDLWKEASPLSHTARNPNPHDESAAFRSPSFLLLNGAADDPALIGQSEEMADALQDGSGRVRAATVEGFESDALVEDEAGRDRAVGELVRFFEDALWHPPSSVVLRRDNVYASPEGRDLHLDLYTPRQTGEPVPAVLFLHGGGWFFGDKRDMEKGAAELASHGFVTASVEYREADERIYPAAVDDAKAAARWLRAHAGELGVDPDRIGVVGSSAGAHLASLLGVTPDRKYFGEPSGPMEPSASVQAVAPISAVVNMPAHINRNRGAPTDFLGVPLAQDPELWREASPVEHIGSDAAPFLFLHGTEDQLTSHAEVVAMAERLRSVGVRAEVFSADEGEHDFWLRERWRRPAMRAMIGFFQETLGGEE